MGYLNNRDYKKIKNIVETFIDNPMIIDNLFKSLVLFLETKNIDIPTKTNIPRDVTKQTSSIATRLRLEEEFKRADDSLNRFSDKLLEESEKRRRKH